MTLSLTGKTAIVTGAAHGVGAAIARHFVDRGARVMCADIDEAQLERDLGPSAHVEGPMRWFAGDLRQRLTVSNLISATLDAFDRVDILVNASREMRAGDALGDDAVEELWAQNVLSALRLSQAVARQMIAQGEDQEDDRAPLGSIIMLSSITARLTHPNLLGLSMASAAVEQMTRSLAVALAPQRIRVNCLATGSVMGVGLQRALRDNPEWREAIREATPLQRIASATELCEAAQFLASDGASFVTGQVLTVDGGRSLIDPARLPLH